MARSRLVVGAVLATANVRDCCDSSRLYLFRGLCLPSLRSAFLPTTHLAFTMWLARDHLPLALLAPGLSGCKCVVIGELQPQRDNLLGFTTSAGFNHEPFAPNYARSSIVAIVGILAVAGNASGWQVLLAAPVSSRVCARKWVNRGVRVELTLTPSS
jgi:hypothetical protein